ncbi:MAG: IreB family regulatory phosphoprotein [Lachnospiraceae bacterium]|jgi:uncharacterized protein (UPF0297 family)|nr:IreB family regulatory phosphoprotein [Lachnospiraceae bacterium]MBQ4000885.1 IreB family regulatory phosphoprotein [Lachnospiraceae bacterium]MBQ6541404.1 IreB family regulatory phosphoprotein [Lachnospiraceae bacterium]MBQ7601021.1 IreB family regulatory phosphoprotein [Lachnospiraceae bacterium]MBR5340222.1 IreB family regulatory phosphoprotein [Lachnospiraceae bacterium]
MGNLNHTQLIRIPDPAENLDPTMDAAAVLREVYGALKEKGYNPELQIVGYIMSGDPTYITNHKNARALVMKVERDELLSELVHHYLETKL